MNTKKFLLVLLLVTGLLVANVGGALAEPPKPSGFYGTVKINGANVADGTIVSGWIGAVKCAEEPVQLSGGETWYNNDVSGDDPLTPGCGTEGATVTFKIGDVSADQTGTWHSGTNIRLDLTATVNYPPEITETDPYEFTIAEDSGTHSFQLHATDANAGDTLTWGVNTAALHGTVSVAGTGGTGSIDYTPNANYNGSDTFKIQVSDGSLTDTITVNATITAAADAPVIAGDDPRAVTMSEDGSPTAFSLTLNASDGDGDTLTWSIDTQATNGTAAASGTGTSKSISYTPDEDYNGSDSFVVQVSDGSLSDTVTVNVTIQAVNDTPSFTKGANQTVDEDAGAQTVNGWATGIDDGDPEVAQTLTFNVTGNTNAALFSAAPAISSAGNLTYTPAANANGSATVTITLSDNGSPVATSASQQFTITVNAVNDEPSFTKGANQAVNEDAGAQTLNGWATNINDNDPETTQTLIFNVSNDNNALFSAQPAVSAAGVLTFTPAANANGSATVSVYLTDNGSGTPPNDNTSPTQTFTITVNPVNDAPTFTKGADQTVNEDAGAQTVNGWATNLNDGDPEVDQSPLAFNVTGNTNTALFSVAPAVAANGTLTYTPAANAAGSATISLTLVDSGSNVAPNVNTSAVQTFVITVASINDAPTFTKGANQTVAEDAGAQTVNGWATAIDDGDAEASQTLLFTVTNDNNALFSAQPAVSAAGVLTFTPAANANGSATVSVYLTDNGSNTPPNDNQSDTQTFTITVTAVNDAPVANAQSVSTPENTPLAITLTGSDIEGSALTYSIVANPSHGALSGTPPNVTYTPTTNYSGSDNFTFKVNDGSLDSAVANVSINVTAVNTAPVITEGDSISRTMSEDGSPTAFSLTLNATDSDGDTLTWSISTQAANGTASASGTGASKAIGYTPNANYNGPDSFVVQVSDGALSDTITVNVTIEAVNDAPVIGGSDPAAVTMSEDGSPTAFNLTLNATDVEAGTTLTWTISTAATNGTAGVTAPGTGTSMAITYAPNANYNGSDSFVVQVSDGTASDTVTVNVTIQPVNDAPDITQTSPQAVTMSEDGAPTAFSLTLNATDVDTGTTLTWTISTAAANGTAAIPSPGTGASISPTYAPNANYNGSDSFVVQVSDGTLADTVTVNVTIQAVNDAPVANNQTVTTSKNIAIAITLTGSDIEGSALRFFIVTNPANGTLSGTEPNVTYTPNTNFTGTDSFTFRANDGALDSNPNGTITVNVSQTNSAPVAQNQSVTTDEDTAKAIVLSATDADNDTLTYTILTNPTNGTLTGTPPNLTYTPNANYHGSDSFTFKARDALVDSNTATVSITVNSVNDAPQLAAIGNKTVNELAALTFTASATDDGGGAITYSLSGAPSGASINASSGAFTWTPTEAQGPGSYPFNVCASDGSLNTCETITVTVNELNQAPVLDPIGSKTVQEGTLLSFTANAYDNDLPANTLTYSLVGAPTGASIDPTTGVFTWTPTADQGPTVYIIDVVVSDGVTTDLESVQITVTEGAPPTYWLYLPMMHKNP
jgi:VCBS repeat-containing protein